MNPLQIAGGVIGIALTLGLGVVIIHCWRVTAEYSAFRDGVEQAVPVLPPKDAA